MAPFWKCESNRGHWVLHFIVEDWTELVQEVFRLITIDKEHDAKAIVRIEAAKSLKIMIVSGMQIAHAIFGGSASKAESPARLANFPKLMAFRKRILLGLH